MSRSPRSARARAILFLAGLALIAPAAWASPVGATPGPAEPSGGSLAAALLWLLAILATGLVALPIANVAFRHLSDRGAGFSKILGLSLATLLSLFAARFRILPNGRLSAWLALAALAGVAIPLFLRRRGEITAFWRARWRTLAAGEAVFAAGFLIFLALRSFNPEIAWGEKPMDFSILNILTRAKAFPPSDPWFSGAPLGYYVFGQQIVAFLTLLTGLPARYTFNLAFGLIGGLTAQGAFSLAWSWAGRARAGVAAAGLMVFTGNLAGLRELLVIQPGRGEARHLDWHYFWATSRVVPDTINEYPFWSLLFADLHAHLLALPLLLLFVAAALELTRSHADAASGAGRRLASAVLLGFAASVHALTNAWDVPLLAGLLLLLLLVTALAESRLSVGAFLRAGLSVILAAGIAVVIVLPLWARGGGLPGYGWNEEPGARGRDVLTHFGLFFLLALGWWLVAAAGRARGVRGGRFARAAVVPALGLLLAAGIFWPEVLCALGVFFFLAVLLMKGREPEERLAAGLAATAFFLVLFPQRAFIYDRMNTFFKLYFEAWPLFALATAVLVFGSPTRPGAFARWPVALRGVFFLFLGACLFTTVTAAYGAVFAPHNPARPGGVRSRPSLDGLAHLERSRPGEYRAVLWLNRALAGTPVLLEAQGDSYQDFSRISMFTGLPTVLGWEHHVKQRGNSEEEVAARREAVRAIFSSPDAEGIAELLRRYHVGYIYVGWLERKTYVPEGLRKFDSAKKMFEPVYENPDVRIYRVIGGDSEDVIVPAREEVPREPRPPQDEPAEPPVFRETAQANASPYSGMREPRDAAVDGQGRLWVADFGNSRLRIFDSRGGSLGGWGGRNSGIYGLREPCAVAIHGEEICIADTWNGRVQCFTLAGEWKAAASSGLYGPRGVAITEDGRVWVCDTGNKRVVLYDPSLTEIRSIGKPGTGPLEFADPVGISVGPGGRVFVADAGNGRIQVLDGEGVFQNALPVASWSRGVEPHLEVDGDGTIYATDPAGDALLEISTEGALVRRWLVDDHGQRFARPTGIALDRKNRILYIVNSGNSTISKRALPKKDTP